MDKIKDELRKLGPLIDLEAIWEPQGSRTERGLSKPVSFRDLSRRASPPSPCCVCGGRWRVAE